MELETPAQFVKRKLAEPDSGFLRVNKDFYILEKRKELRINVIAITFLSVCMVMCLSLSVWYWFDNLVLWAFCIVGTFACIVSSAFMWRRLIKMNNGIASIERNGKPVKVLVTKIFMFMPNSSRYVSFEFSIEGDDRVYTAPFSLDANYPLPWGIMIDKTAIAIDEEKKYEYVEVNKEVPAIVGNDRKILFLNTCNNKANVVE